MSSGREAASNGSSGNRGGRSSQRCGQFDHHARLLVITAVLILASFGPALAEFKICNQTPSRVGVAIGYRDTEDATGWTTEGWWNISALSCETLLRDRVPGRYLYVYAIDYERGGEWSGDKNLCTAENAFVIREVQDCAAQGYRTNGFYRVDTGTEQSWTIRLADPEGSRAETNDQTQ